MDQFYDTFTKIDFVKVYKVVKLDYNIREYSVTEAVVTYVSYAVFDD